MHVWYRLESLQKLKLPKLISLCDGFDWCGKERETILQYGAGMTPFVSQYNVKGYSYIDTAIIVLYRKKEKRSSQQ